MSRSSEYAGPTETCHGAVHVAVRVVQAASHNPRGNRTFCREKTYECVCTRHIGCRGPRHVCTLIETPQVAGRPAKHGINRTVKL